MRLKAFGKFDEAESRYKSDLEGYFDLEVKYVVDLYSQKSEGESITIEDIELDDIIELEDEYGYVKITNVYDLYNDFIPFLERGEKLPDELILNDLVSIHESNRGSIKRFFQRIKFLRVDKVLAGLTITKLTEKLENKFMENEGVFKCSDPNHLGARVDKIPSSETPILLLIHGTAVNTHATFGGLITDGDKSIWDNIKDIYQDNIYACEHKTLSKSPLENAIMIAETLPKEATIHIVSGSRGGLIGEILSQFLAETDGEKGFTEDEIAVFEALDDRKEDIKHLKQLNKLFKQKKIKVERFVRVACPSAGTTLASKRLDTYFNIILNLIKLLPFVNNGPVYRFIKSYLIAVVKTKADVNLLPGLEAMMPSSPLIKVLNNPLKSIDSELIIVSGDAVPRGGILHAIKVKLIDLFYRAENDFIVNTAAMYGGIKRSNTHYFFHQHQTTNHFKYFSNPPTQQAILIGLKGEASNTPSFKVLESEKSKGVMDLIRSKKVNKHAPIAFVIPGIMGSKLKAGSQKIWVNLLRLAMGNMDKLKIDNPDVEAYDLMGSAYSDLVEYLAGTHQVVCFPYDWRNSVEIAADELAKSIKEKLKNTDKSIHLVAHSLGGVVVQVLYNKHKNIWNELKQREGSKVLLLGSPLRGSHIIPQVMLREERFFKILHSLDFKNTQKDLLKILMKYPGILELLPSNGPNNNSAIDGINYFDMSIYKALESVDGKFAKPTVADIKRAAKLSESMAKDPIQGSNVYYVAGKDKVTPAKLIAPKDGNGDYKLLGTALGDGRVTWDSVINDDFKFNKIWYMNASHGSMCNTAEYFEAIIEILTYGKTAQLSKYPIVERGVEDYFEIPEEEPIALWSEEGYEAGILGLEKQIAVEAAFSTVKIQITHGDLGNSKFPVAVGHHLNDGIVSAENVINNYMNNRLSNYLYTGLYPGEMQSSLVVLNDTGHFEGAIIVGLGDFGKLTKGELEETFAHALIDYMMTEEERHNSIKNTANKRKKIGVSTLLIGSRYAGLSLSDSIMSLLNGVTHANQKLANMAELNINQISEIEFIELYEDRAISAANVVNNLIKDGRFQEFELLKPVLKKVSGSRQRIKDNQANDWWFRLQITEEESTNGLRPLKFVSITDRALSEVRILPTQRQLVEKLLKSAVSTAKYNPDLASTLYALIVPNELKDFAVDKRDLMLLLDKQSATYPWELLHDPSDPSKKPIATQSGIVRQLASDRFNRMAKYAIKDIAYVIGDPLSPVAFPELPGALDEAKDVSNLLKENGFETTTSFNQNAEATMIKLFKNNYKVLHIAGHGIIDENDPLKTGVVLSNGILITPAEIKQMKEVPEFVFINCCYSGDMNGERIGVDNRHVLAANLGTQFIENGVKAIVVAGWAVNDAAAKTFSNILYKEMLSGGKFGESVKKAREITYNNHGNTNTWGAYQCYGNQFYELRSRRKHRGSKKKEYVHPKEALIDIKNIRSGSDVRSSGEVINLVNKMDSIVTGMPMQWHNRSDVLEALGSAFYELKEYKKSLHYFGLLRHSNGDGYTLSGMRTLSNLYMKLAITMFRNTPVDKIQKLKIKTYAEESEFLAKWLLDLGETSYRLGLIGGNYKRKSLLSTNKTSRITALKKSRDSYKKGYELITTQKNADNYYHLINWLTLEEILTFYNVGKSNVILKAAKVNAIIKASKAFQQEKFEDSQSFWGQVSQAAFEAFELFKMANNKSKSEDSVAKILNIYFKAWQIGGSIRKSENILEHFKFVLESLERVPRPGLTRYKKEKLENTIHVFQLLYNGLKKILVDQ